MFSYSGSFRDTRGDGYAISFYALFHSLNGWLSMHALAFI